MANGNTQPPVNNTKVNSRNVFNPQTGLMETEYYVNTPYGASRITYDQAFKIATDQARSAGRGNVFVPGSGQGTAKAQRDYERGAANIKTRRALSGLGYNEQKRGIKRAGKGAIAGQQTAQAHTKGAVRGPLGSMPVEYLSRQMGRGLAQADIAQGQQEAKFTQEMFDLGKAREEALYQVMLSRAQAVDARAREIAAQLEAQGFSPELVARVVDSIRGEQ